MELEEFLLQTQAEVRAEISERMTSEGSEYPYAEIVFTEVVMQHLSEIGMTYEPQACHYSNKVGNANLKLSGFAASDDGDQLDLFVSLYGGVDDIVAITDTETKTAAEQCLRFFKSCVDSKLAKTMDESHDAYGLAMTIQQCYRNLDQVRIYVLTDKRAKTKNFQPREVNDITVRLEVVDIERLHRHWSEGKPRDELVINFGDVCGSALPCVFVSNKGADYDYALTILPGEALRHLYERYGSRLLEANVRSFLSATVKVNKGIRETLRFDPAKFMAYNNGVVLIADEASFGKTSDGGPGILWLKGMQIVNGGQTTASIYFTKKKNPEIDLSMVQVPAKVIILRAAMEPVAEESLISDISRYANSQTAVKMSDLSANKPYHVALENLANTIYCPDGTGRWFYERAAGSYNVMLTREGTTSARVKRLKAEIPTYRRITKTDLAKFIHTWEMKPDLVSKGAQKNFEIFMSQITDGPGRPLPDATDYKRIVAVAILYKKAQTLFRPLFKASQGNVATYTISILAKLLGDRLDLERVWHAQTLSPQLTAQLRTWGTEVHDVLVSTAAGRMISEWAKKPECWQTIQSVAYSTPQGDIPEVRNLPSS